MLGNISLEERVKIQTLNDKGYKAGQLHEY